MKIRFWGVRGTRPVPGKKTMKYGGNTSCVEISAGEEVMIMDAGTGIVNFGDEILKNKVEKVSLFITHTHWDHIQGLPMFKPLYQKDFTLDIYGPETFSSELEKVLSKQMSPEFYPISWESLPSNKSVMQLKAQDTVDIGGQMKVTAFNASHTCACLNYKIEHEGKVCIYATDNEWEKSGKNELMEIIKDCDLLILDTFFTDEEYYGINGNASRIGWGHGSWQKGVEMAKRCNVKRLVMFHHGENRFDEELEAIEKEAKAVFGAVSAAKEGMVIDL